MGKITLLVPREEMIRQAHNILQEKKYQIQEMKVTTTESAVTEARRSIAEGTSVIIARGLQASLIRKYTSVPVVEIVLTAQEMALLVMRARQIVKKRRPVIAVIGFENMFCDMSFFDELYGIELRTYFVKQDEELADAAQMAVEDGVDLMIGGDTVVSIAEENHIQSLFLALTEDALRNAFAAAERLDYAMNAEKKAAAQMETILDYSYNGVIQVDRMGIITTVNAFMEDLAGINKEELSGKNIGDIFPQVNESVWEQVLKEGKEYAMFIEWKQIPLFLVMAPVLYEENVDGAVIACHRMIKRPSAGTREPSDKAAECSGRGSFDDILQKSKKMQECIRKARLYAMSEYPLALQGETGTEKRLLAACIHGNSSRVEESFLDISCAGMTGEEQVKLLFGEYGAVMQAKRGTLLIQNAEKLTLENQHRLYQLIQFHVCHGMDMAQIRKADVRLILTISEPLAELAAQGILCPELYYLLAGHELSIPPMRERPEDLKQKIDDTIKMCRRKYNRYHVLTNGAKELLYKYSWKGNLIQIEGFCDSLILTAKKRSIDEIAVKALLKELYPEYVMVQNLSQPAALTLLENPFACSEEAQQIIRTLQKHGGNRERTASELGISKTTLWRHMKKYGIEL